MDPVNVCMWCQHTHYQRTDDYWLSGLNMRQCDVSSDVTGSSDQLCVAGCFIYLLISWFVCFNTNINMRVIWPVNNQWSESVRPWDSWISWFKQSNFIDTVQFTQTEQSKDETDEEVKSDCWCDRPYWLIIIKCIHSGVEELIHTRESVKLILTEPTGGKKEQVMSSSCFNRKCVT